MNSIERLLDLDVSGIGTREEGVVEISLSKLGGEVFAFPIQELDNATRAAVMENSFHIVSGPDGAEAKTNLYGVAKMTIVEGCIIFKDKRYRDKFNVRSGEALVDKMLTLSEAIKLSDAIQELGNDEGTSLLEDLEGLKGEIKN